MDDDEPLSYAQITISDSLLDPSLWIIGVILLLLIFFSAMVSGSEIAFFSLSPNDKQKIREDKTTNSEYVLSLLNNSKELLAIILILNNLFNIGIVILSSYLFLVFYPVPENGMDLFRSVIEVVGITFLILLFGEVLPKVYANKYGLDLSYKMSKPLFKLKNLPPFSWLVRALVNGTDFITRMARKKAIDISSNDLEAALAITREETTTEQEQKILEGIVNFGNTDVKQIMSARTDTVALDESTSFSDMMEVILDAGYSRIPVYKENFDHVTGVLYTKDLLPHLNEGASFKWNKLIRAPYFVPENKKIDDLLKEFQEKKIHMAIVVDEYGGASGIVTLEDVLEEIVGEITDEFDDDDITYSKVDENTFVFEGKTALVDLYKVLQIDGKKFEEAKGESDTIAGFMIEQSGKLMQFGEIVAFENIDFIVEVADKKRIRTVKVVAHPTKEEDE